VANAFFNLLWAFGYWCAIKFPVYKSKGNDISGEIITTAVWGLAVIELIIGAFLVVGVFTLRKLVIQGHPEAAFDYKFLAIHILTFSMFIVSSLVYDVYYAIFLLGNKPGHRPRA